MDLINQPEVSKWIEQGRDKEHIYAVKNFLTGQGKVMVDRLISQANHMTKENIECECACHKGSIGDRVVCNCFCTKTHSPKVELPKSEEIIESLENKLNCIKDISEQALPYEQIVKRIKLALTGKWEKPDIQSKVELPEWEKEFDKRWQDPMEKKMGKGFALYCSFCGGEWREEIKDFIHQTISHSTAQLVEKIMGEVKGLKAGSENVDKGSWAYQFIEERNEVIKNVIKIISKYK